MSRVYFHTPSGDAELLGSERAHAGLLVQEVAEQRITNGSLCTSDTLRKLASGSYLASHPESTFARDFLVALHVQRGRLLTWRDREITASSLTLNTALVLGDDVMKLVARLHGQCEIHAYVEGPNRKWLADLIERGLASGVLREGMGWDSPPHHPHGKGPGVIPLLRSRDDEPVVMSYSVGNSFPYAAHISMPLPEEGWMPNTWTAQEWADLGEDERDDYREEGRSETFADLSENEQWTRAMSWLRERSKTMLLEFKPDGWDTYRFGHGLSLLDLEASDWRQRVESALGLPPETSAVPEEDRHA